ncbi:DUF6221 family protein [Streptomyces sp. NBC_01343]|uniref:DUF6221 family protein n=1 Tax=Streptomyces sp. NBC_01343 TaxID=2903832 RepID=UPI002E11B44A|nr:DUF6221 family protein [Streptomyces sp. NBC_01343]
MTRDFEVMMEFLWARLREDETAARALKPGKNEDVIRLRDRVLADVEAKRRLVHWVHEVPWVVEDKPRTIFEGALMDAIASVPLKRRSPVAFTLLASYVDHPDFRPEWKLIVGEAETEIRNHDQERTP